MANRAGLTTIAMLDECLEASKWRRGRGTRPSKPKGPTGAVNEKFRRILQLKGVSCKVQRFKGFWPLWLE